jgi:5-methylcytosine-specific restriction endonuclease McrA
VFDVPEKATVFARDAFTCQYCGCRVTLRNGTRDHVQPRSRGGRDVLSNVVTACAACNFRKDDRTPAEAGMHLRAMPRALNEEEKLACLLRSVRSEERQAWIACLRRNGITLWTARAA